jgi:transcriptional regulator NrdR family protein
MMVRSNIILVRRAGHLEKYDERKCYASVYAACASAHMKEMECEKIADEVITKLKTWLKGKKEVDSLDIRKKIGAELKRRSKQLNFYYEQHLPNLKSL